MEGMEEMEGRVNYVILFKAFTKVRRKGIRSQGSKKHPSRGLIYKGHGL
jgi:hypothetical protein